MMKRRTIILVGIFLGLLLVFGLYSLFTEEGEIFAPKPEKADIQRMPITQREGVTDIPGGKELLLVPRREDGSREGIYQAKEWHSQPDGSYLLIEPKVEIYQPDGWRIEIRADKGTVYAEETAGGLDIKRGSLSGNGQVCFFDRPATVGSKETSESDDVVARIYVDDIEFDNNLLTIYTDGRFVLFSDMADIIGRGLSISWNEEPRELRLLRIEEGEMIVVKDIPEQFAISLPGGVSGDGEVNEAELLETKRSIPLESLLPVRPADTQPSGHSTSSPATKPEVAESIQGIVINEPSSRPSATIPSMLWEELETTIPADLNAQGEKPGRRLRQNIYLAVFEDSINVDFVDPNTGGVQGADKLSLEFQWEEKSRPFERRESQTPPVESTTQPTSMPAVEPKQQQANPMIITWAGPLVLKPVGHTPDPSMDNFKISAQGERIKLRDSRAKGICREFAFDRSSGKGRLSGTQQAPVELQITEETKLICGRVDFDQDMELVTIDGPGEMEISPDAEQQIETSGRITWDDCVVARLDGNSISEAVFRGSVNLEQGGSNFLRSHLQHVWMATGSDGKPYPRRVEAKDNVSARQGRNNIKKAGKLTLDMQEDFEPVLLIAEKDVEIEILEDANKPTVLIAEYIEGDLKSETFKADGKGLLRFQVDRDFNGKLLSKLRPVEIAWSDRMIFDGERDDTRFEGDVRLTSLTEKISCHKEMYLMFERSEDAEMAEGQQPEGMTAESRSETGLGIDSYRGRRLSVIHARGDVRLLSSRKDEEDRLTQRIQLAAPNELVYDVSNGEMNVFGPGTFGVENYNPPERNEGDSPPASEGLGSKLERPFQVAFGWDEHMSFLQEQREVVLKGEVQMRYQSGEYVDDNGIRHPAWGKLAGGRRISLGCQELLAKFAPAKEPVSGDSTEPQSPDTDDLTETLDIERLELFYAMGDVNLQDGPVRIIGQRLSYDRTVGMAVVWGYLEGQKPTPATVINKDQASTTESERIICLFDEEGNLIKVETPEVRGSGGR